MAEVTITGLPNAATLTGTERVPMDQAGTTVDASAQAIADLATAATIGLGNVNNTSDASKPISTATQAALDLKAAASAISNVNNTSDLAKPISTATQAALDLKAAASHTHDASTITGLATVATSGAYTDLSGRPGLATVATSGAYTDLSSRPALGTAAPLDVAATGDASATQVVKGNDARLSDARTPAAHNQAASTITGLGGAAVLSVGTTSGTVAAGDDSRITGALSTTTAATTYQPLASNLTSLGAQAPSYYLDRANGTGTQAASTITGLKDQIGIACSDVTSNLTASTSVAKETLRMPYAMTLTQVRLNVGTAPTDSALIVNIKQGGTTIFSTRPQIDANAKTSVGSGTAAVFATTALTDDAEITIFVDQIGSTIAGSGLKVWLIGTRA